MEAPRGLWGFGGLHGGLALASMATRMHRSRPPARLRSISGRFLRAIRSPFAVEAIREVEAGKAISYAARITADGHACATASAVYGAARSSVIAFPGDLSAPAVPSWEVCVPLVVPREWAPVAQQTEIRPAGRNRPFAGGSEPELTAWVRLVGDDAPPDLFRLIFLSDALAPSYSAILDTPQQIPTVELAAHFTQKAARSPWVLISARTDCVTEDGWLTERIDVWNCDGDLLALARQLRVIRDDRSGAPAGPHNGPEVRL